MSEQVETGMPASLAAAWGVRARPAKGPKPALTLDRIVAAAMDVADAEGVAAVSMAKVAAALGASTMSLYRYVAAKDELLALMLDAATGVPPAMDVPPGDWRAGLTAWARAMRTAVRSRPWVVHLQLSGPPITPQQMAWLERGLAFLRDIGLPPQHKLSVIMLVSGYVWRESQLMIDIEAAMSRDDKWQKMLLNYGANLAALADPATFPELTALIDAGIFDAPDDPDDDFNFNLDRILDGIATLIS
jgi:AcrR family transcriptional regulator